MSNRRAYPEAFGAAGPQAQTVDTVVVGGGIVGLLSALALHRAGQTVVVLDAGSAGAAQSGRNMGFIRQQGREAGEAELVKRASELWRHLHAELGPNLDLVDGGHISVARTPASAAQIRAWQPTAIANGIPFEVLEGATVTERFPWLDRAVTTAGFTPQDFHVDPASAMRAVCELVTARGIRIVEHTPVTELDVQAGRVVGVHSSNLSVRARATVLAAGIWTPRLLRPHGVRLPQFTGVGTVARTAPTAPITPCSVWDVSGIGIRQDRTGRINFGLGQYVDIDLGWEEAASSFRLLPTYLRSWRTMKITAGRKLASDVRARLAGRSLPPLPLGDPGPSERLVRKARAELVRLVPSLDPSLPVEFSWAGTIDGTEDFLPVVGDVGLDGLVVASGMSGHGMGVAPAIAEAVAEIILAGAPSRVDVSSLHPSRLGGFRPFASRSVG